MSEITIVGLGSMGSALAQALCRSGHRITVWNRTAARMEALIREGAVAAGSLAEAVRSSPILLVCIDNYDATRRMLEAGGVLPDLAERVLVQLSTGTPRDARLAKAWLDPYGVAYLDGAILGGPALVGTDGFQLLIGGSEAAFARFRPLGQAFGGKMVYTGDDVAAPAALDLAWLSQRIGLFLGLSHGARLCQVEGVDMAVFAAMFAPGDRSRLFIDVVRNETYAKDPPATVETWQHVVQHLQAQARDAAMPTFLLDTAEKLFDRAMRAGLAREDVAALTKILTIG